MGFSLTYVGAVVPGPYGRYPLDLYAPVYGQPLHFGDYGGLTMKIIWALLDIITIIVLASGIYLWLGKRRSALEQRLAELIGGAGSQTTATAEA
jgi:uncharacterized iron-regulated membrane protein